VRRSKRREAGLRNDRRASDLSKTRSDRLAKGQKRAEIQNYGGKTASLGWGYCLKSALMDRILEARGKRKLQAPPVCSSHRVESHIFYVANIGRSPGYESVISLWVWCISEQRHMERNSCYAHHAAQPGLPASTIIGTHRNWDRCGDRPLLYRIRRAENTKVGQRSEQCGNVDCRAEISPQTALKACAPTNSRCSRCCWWYTREP